MKTFRFALRLFIFTFLSSSIFCSSPVLAESDRASEVTLSWDEFKKMLKLDANEIILTWDEFQQLLKQTGEEVKLDYSVQNGQVVLPRSQFQALLDKMQPPPAEKPSPPSDYIITKADYSGRMTDDSTEITAEFSLEIFERPENNFLQISLLPANAALVDVTLNGAPALMTEANSWYYLTTDKVGQFTVKVRFFYPSNLKKGPQVLSLPVIKTAITLFDLTIPGEDIEPEISDAKESEVTPQNGFTRITAILPATNLINVTTHRKYDALDGAPTDAEVEAKIYAETFNLLSIEEDALQVLSLIKLNILQKTIPFVDCLVPENYSILHVRQINQLEIRDWQTIDTDSATVLRIPFDTPLEGNALVTITAEQLFADDQQQVEFTGFQIVDAIRETGFIGAEKKSAAEAAPIVNEHLDRLDIKDLPYDLINMSQRPLLFGFRYLRHPYNLTLGITKHQELPTISSVIDMASVITVVLDDGKFLTKIVYTVRNTWKQFLELQLPDDAEIWTLYVAGKRENASKNAAGTVMIPLARSEMSGESLNSFTVDLMYFHQGEPLKIFGNRAIVFPQADIMVSKMLWSVYLPQEFRYLHFSGDVEKEELAESMNLIMGTRRDFSLDDVEIYKQAARDYEQTPDSQIRSAPPVQQQQYSLFQNSAIRRGDLAQQMMNEANLDQVIQTEQKKGLGQPGSTGELMKIEMPTSGQIYRFNKTVIEGEAIALTVWFASPWVITVSKIVIVLLSLIILILMRRVFFRIIRGIYRRIASWQTIWGFVGTRKGMRTTLFIGAFIFYFLSKWLFFILFILFLIACFRPHWLLRSREMAETPSEILSSDKINPVKNPTESESNQ